MTPRRGGGGAVREGDPCTHQHRMAGLRHGERCSARPMQLCPLPGCRLHPKAHFPRPQGGGGGGWRHRFGTQTRVTSPPGHTGSCQAAKHLFIFFLHITFPFQPWAMAKKNPSVPPLCQEIPSPAPALCWLQTPPAQHGDRRKNSVSGWGWGV